MRSTKGFFQLSRAAVALLDHRSLAVYANLRSWASWRDTDKIKKNYVLTSLGELATSTGLDRKTVKNRLDLLAELNIISYRRSKNGYPMNGFEVYTPRDFPIPDPSNLPWENGHTPSKIGTLPIQNEASKRTHKKNEEYKNNKNSSVGFSIKHSDLANRWFTEIYSQRFPDKKININPWADEIRKLEEIDRHSIEDIRKALEFVKTDDFWMTNALSVVGLRKKSKSNGLTKFQNILMAMDRRNTSPTGPKNSGPNYKELN